MSEAVSDSPQSARRRTPPGVLWFLLALGLLLAALVGWKIWSDRRPAERAESVDLSAEALDARLLQVEAALTMLRRNQGAMNQKLTDTRARTGLLRDEVLAVTQRSSLLEDSVRELANSRRDGVEALRLDEVEMLLTIAQQRLQLTGDLPGAVRATELAEGVLSTQRDPALLDVRQTLAQELSALRALPVNPAARAAGELDALEAVLPRLASGGATGTPAGDAQGDSGLERLLDSLVQVRRSGQQDLVAPSDRSAGEAALSLELALARTALARTDEAAFRASIGRIDGWLLRLFPDGPLLRERRRHLAQLKLLPLSFQLPVAGSTLQQLQVLQRTRLSAK